MDNAFDIITKIGGTLGTGAALLFGYMYNKIRDLECRVNKLEQDSAALLKTLSDIRADVAFIKGKMEN